MALIQRKAASPHAEIEKPAACPSLRERRGFQYGEIGTEKQKAVAAWRPLYGARSSKPAAHSDSASLPPTQRHVLARLPRHLERIGKRQ